MWSARMHSPPRLARRWRRPGEQAPRVGVNAASPAGILLRVRLGGLGRQDPRGRQGRNRLGGASGSACSSRPGAPSLGCVPRCAARPTAAQATDRMRRAWSCSIFSSRPRSPRQHAEPARALRVSALARSAARGFPVRASVHAPHGAQRRPDGLPAASLPGPDLGALRQKNERRLAAPLAQQSPPGTPSVASTSCTRP
jgi:hypothetical protein